MHAAYFSNVMNSCEHKYAKAEKECLEVLYAEMNFRPYLYGREFILACDYEPIPWITHVENPAARLLRWRPRLQDYQYKFKHKQGKLNSGVEVLSGNPVLKKSSGSSSESSKDLDDPVRPSQLPLFTESDSSVPASNKSGQA